MALFAIVCSTSVNAQRKVEADTGSAIPIPQRARIPDAAGLSADDRSRIAMAEFARCTVDRKTVALKKVLSLPIEKLDGHVWRSLADDECLSSGEMQFKPIIMRGALFGELVRRRAYEAAHGSVWSFPVTPYDAAALANSENGVGQLDAALLAFADCVVDRDPVKAQAIVLAPIASRAETDAIAALGPNLSPCLSAGRTIKLTKLLLEGAVAEIVYRATAKPGRTETK